MMNELNVLSELMESPKNGYQLQKALQMPVGPYRKVSFGVIYPLLDRLAKAGAIELKASGDGKIATITPAGRERFMALMADPIPKGAHTDDIYRIKLDAMQHLPLSDQFDLLTMYRAEQDRVIAHSQENIDRLNAVAKIDHWYAAQRIRLHIVQAQATLEWISDFQTRLEKGEVPHA
ncbi:PadR family transcriptional regulator [Lacticaseibacillus brantae]|uniref:Transcription regulator PadR N-terminal domain-containing protein n=1 Tax=Lacticaseibacillus brantae DSM 23927 TaxID=1423727 RepID=A0A0R2AV93_9LACO|nr:PadR family transcriptional regulator [Lacticaseibacillus brantae]KRM71342.1 hypothetical protein FC34_GL001822 [Lacticaseibacillus brantae DSM 23927]